MICELQRKWSKPIIKRLNLQTQIMQIKLGTALRQSDVMLKHISSTKTKLFKVILSLLKKKIKYAKFNIILV